MVDKILAQQITTTQREIIEANTICDDITKITNDIALIVALIGSAGFLIENIGEHEKITVWLKIAFNSGVILTFFMGLILLLQTQGKEKLEDRLWQLYEKTITPHQGDQQRADEASPGEI